MKPFIGIEYSRGARAIPADGGPLFGPRAVQKMFPDASWTIIPNTPCDITNCAADRFGDAFSVQKQIFAQTPASRHIMIGGDHSVNFGHFAALADRLPAQNLCLVYIDAHLDIHSPTTSRAQATGAPHGTNVRALMGDGDTRWLGLQSVRPALQPENLFYLGTRSYEPAEIEFVTANSIFMRRASELATRADLENAVQEIMKRIGNKPYVVSFDFDAIDPTVFPDVWVPEPDGITVDAAEYFVRAFAPMAHGFEFVEYAPSGNMNCARIVKTLVQIVADAD